MLGVYFDITSGDMTTALGYSGDIVGDLMPVIVVFIGITIGFAIYRNLRK
jgi:hypothetical protein